MCPLGHIGMPHTTTGTPQGHWGRRDRPHPSWSRGRVVCGRTGQAQTRPGSGLSEVDAGRCGAPCGVPHPPSQPSGPRGPLGSRPAHLAPGGGVQAPKPRPIQALAGSEALVGARPVWPHTTHPRNRGGCGLSSRPQGPFGVTGVAWGMSVCPREREIAYLSKYPRNRLG